jgi:hypothetical protein
MAFSTSPYQQNDYQAVSQYRPYELPVNDIFKGISAQNQFWDEGARRVKAYYDNALNLRLSLEPNKQLRDNFMQQAEKEISKLSSMNLADPSVQKKGFSIFKPIFEDIGIMSDDQATRHIDKVKADINRARTTEGGKFYADTNAMVALDGIDDFLSATDRNAGAQFLKKAKSYINYYNPADEVTNIMKNCKGPTVSMGPRPEDGSMYMHTQENSGASPSRVAACLQYALSEQAKNQLRIDGYAAYLTPNRIDNPDGKNYNALANDYVGFAGETLKSLDQDIKDSDGKILAYKALYEKTKDEKYLNLQKAHETHKQEILGRAKNINESFNNIKNGNLDFIKHNFENLAEQIHTKRTIGGLSEAFRTDVTIDKYSADAVKLQNQRLEYDAEKTATGRDHDKEMAALEHQYKLEELYLSGQLKGKKLNADGTVTEAFDVTNPAMTEDNKAVVDNGFEAFNAEIGAVDKLMADANTMLFNRLRTKYPDLLKDYTVESFFKPGPNGVSAGLSFLDAQGKSGVNDGDIQNWSATVTPLINKKQLFEVQKNLNEARLQRDNSNLFDRSHLNDFKPVTLSDGTVVTPQMVQDALEGKPSILRIDRGSSGTTSSSGTTGATVNSGYTPTEYYVNGKLIETTYGKKDNKLHSLVRDITSKTYEKNTELNKVRNSVYGQSILTLKPTVFAAYRNNDDDDAFRIRVATSVGLNWKTDKGNVQIVSYDPSTGDADVRIIGNKEFPVDNTSILSKLKYTMNADASLMSSGDNEVVVKIKGDNTLKSASLNENPLQILQLSLDKINLSLNDPKGLYASVQPGNTIMNIPIQTKGYKGTEYNIEVIRGMGGTAQYVPWVKQKTGDGIGQYKSLDITFNTSNELLSFLHQADKGASTKR